ncbi:hypothetical protein ACE6H2_026516 [Prunus campanulata]
MGFRDFHDLNLALLAKQCWRLLTELDSLWARLIKARYFPKCNFIEATKGSRASWVSASLIEGRKVILNGARWQIMNGVQARIWTDKWITNIQGGVLCPAPGASMDINATVETIIDWNSRSWKLDLIRPLLLTKEAFAIQRIPIGRSSKVDHLVWPDEKNGKYSVRSGYHNIHTHHHRISKHRPSSSMSIDPRVWKWIWHADVTPKIHHFF